MYIIGQIEHIINIKYNYDFGMGNETDNQTIILSDNEYEKIMDIDNENEFIEMIYKLTNLNRNFNIVMVTEMYFYNNEFNMVNLYGGE